MSIASSRLPCLQDGQIYNLGTNDTSNITFRRNCPKGLRESRFGQNLIFTSDECTRKRRKCDSAVPRCHRCSKSNTTCVYSLNKLRTRSRPTQTSTASIPIQTTTLPTSPISPSSPTSSTPTSSYPSPPLTMSPQNSLHFPQGFNLPGTDSRQNMIPTSSMYYNQAYTPIQPQHGSYEHAPTSTSYMQYYTMVPPSPPLFPVDRMQNQSE